MKTTKNAATKAAEGLTAEQTAEQAKAAPKAEKRPKKAAAPKNAPKAERNAEQAEKAEQTVKERGITMTAEAIRALFEESKNAVTADMRKTAAERFEREAAAFNAAALHNAVNRASFIAAAEAYRPNEPKKAESRMNGVDYTRRAGLIQYIQIDDEGEANQKTLNLTVYAAEAFAEGLTNAEQNEAVETALTAFDVYLKNAVMHEGEEGREGLKKAAAALTALCRACGIDRLTTKKTEGGDFPFYIDRSFLLAVGARMRGKRGVFETPNATRESARLSLLTADDKRRERAAERAAKAERAAVKMLFAIIAEAAKAAIYGNWKAEVLTAEGVREQAAKKAAEAAKKAEEREQAAKAKAKAAAKAAAERAEKAEERAKKAKAKAAEAAAKLTA